MSEVHRYQVVKMLSEDGNKIAYGPNGPWIVMARDFDRVTAERDKVLGRVTDLEASFDELAASVGFSEARLDQTGDSPIDCANQLQQRLTAAYERADVLETALRKIKVRLDAYAEADMRMPESSVEVCQMIADAALKPAEGGGDA